MPQPRLRLRGCGRRLGRRAAAAAQQRGRGAPAAVFSTASRSSSRRCGQPAQPTSPRMRATLACRRRDQWRRARVERDGRLFEQLRASSAPSAAAARPEGSHFRGPCMIARVRPASTRRWTSAAHRRQFVNRDGSRPVRDSDQHWAFLPNTALRQELRHERALCHRQFRGADAAAEAAQAEAPGEAGVRGRAHALQQAQRRLRRARPDRAPARLQQQMRKGTSR